MLEVALSSQITLCGGSYSTLLFITGFKLAGVVVWFGGGVGGGGMSALVRIFFKIHDIANGR